MRCVKSPMQAYDIWPKPKMNLSDLFSVVSLSKYIEEFFEHRYHGAYAVFMPSGRSAITLILQHLGISRRDHVWIPPYSSHCVVNAVGYVGTPSPQKNDSNTVGICFHQWGFVKKLSHNSPIIEDSVVSLITSVGGLFPNDGRFEILSLSKIFASICGGLILCQRAKDAKALRDLRVTRKDLGCSHFLMRLLGQISSKAYSYWSAVEPLNGRTTAGLEANVWRKIGTIDQIIEDRQIKIALLMDSSLKSVEQPSPARLPICWPVDISDTPFGIEQNPSTVRHMLMSGYSQNPRKVYPIPIHQDVPVSHLQTLVGVNG